MRPVLQLEAIEDHIEVLLGEIGLKQPAIARGVQLYGDAVFFADDDAGVVHCNGLALQRAVHVRLGVVLRRHQEPILLGDDDPRRWRVLQSEVRHLDVGGGVEIGQQRQVLMAIDGVGRGFAAGLDADLELAAGRSQRRA